MSTPRPPWTAPARPPRPVPAAVPPWQFPRIHEERLANGVTLLTCDRPGQELLTAEIVVASPLACEPRDVEGVMGILASALAEGVRGTSALDFAHALEHCGATLGVGADHAGLRVTLDVPGPYLERALGLVVSALREPLLPAPAVERLRRSRLHACARERLDSERRASAELHRVVFAPQDRRSRPARGTEETVRQIDRDAVAAFHAAHVRPAVTTVVLVGDLTRHPADRALRRLLGGWHGEPGAPEVRPAPPVRDGPAVVLVDSPEAVQTRLVLGRAAAGRATPGWDPLLIGNHCLGSSVTSRLDRELREAKGYTYGFHSRLLAMGRQSLAVATGAVAAASTAAALDGVLSILRGLGSQGLTERERDAAVAQIVTAAPIRYLRSADVAEEIALLVLDGRAPDSLPDAFARVAALSAQDATAALLSAFRPEAMVTVAVGDAAAFQAGVEDLGIGPLTVV
ncbi:insulinase family protein [Streptomyces sp. ISL-43]|uniref:M16 family metallopeptidase n=1 Tax=Streptomyces sp. ISL-43 TaxID=2819183 RepID=UPI001BE89D2F|nr:pitrilysin family protein [Streptomyces sp. ISL-43]MBT2450992.1 insulinase family protein [Streptomyces sp. ISL-43]